MQNSASRWIAAALAIYGLLWIAPVIVVWPIDKFLEALRGQEYAAGGTPGMMVWTITVIAYPIGVVLSLLVWAILRRRK